MEHLPRLKAHLSSLHELQEIIRALRALAASRVQEGQGTLAGIRRYVETVEDAIAAAATLPPEKMAPAPVAVAPMERVLVVICSEHGFVGGFNDKLLEASTDAQKPGQKLVVIGKRGATQAAERKLEIEHSFSMATHVGGVLGVARRVATYLASAATAEVAFARYQRGGAYTPEIKAILPLDPGLLMRGSQGTSPPLHHLSADELLERLASEYLFAEITRAIMESLVSENGARLHVMENADHNISDKLGELRQLEHGLRQEAITSELLDLITGSEAILSESEVR